MRIRSDTSPTKTPRRRPAKKAAPARRPGYEQARTDFHARAQLWLRNQPHQTVRLPQELAAVTALGIPCLDCGDLVYRDRQGGHAVEWDMNSTDHWASGITARCR